MRETRPVKQYSVIEGSVNISKQQRTLLDYARPSFTRMESSTMKAALVAIHTLAINRLCNSLIL